MFKVVILLSVLMSTQQALSLTAFLMNPRIISRSMFMAVESGVNFEIPKHRSSKGVKGQGFHSVTLFSYAQLVMWLRKLSSKHNTADLEIFANGVLVFDNASFTTLDTSTVHQLQVKTLSRDLKLYNSIESLMQYAQVGIIEYSDIASTFPTIDRTTAFKRHCEDIVNHTIDLINTCVVDPTSGMFVRDIISKVWVNAALTANQELRKMHPAPPAPFDKVFVEFETQVKGKRAHGALDFVMHVASTTGILSLLEVKNPKSPVTEGIFQALSQMVAVRDQTLHYYAQKYVNVAEAKIKAVLDKFPSIGMVSSGEDWIFLEYRWEPRICSWRAFKSPVYTLKFPTSEADRKELQGQVEGLVTFIAGAALLQQRNALAQEVMLNALIAVP